MGAMLVLRSLIKRVLETDETGTRRETQNYPTSKLERGVEMFNCSLEIRHEVVQKRAATVNKAEIELLIHKIDLIKLT